MYKKFIVLILLISCHMPSFCNNDESIKLSINNIKKNFFKTHKFDQNNYWVAVAQGAYTKQYYSRDTFISFWGASNYEELRPVFSHAIDWFLAYQTRMVIYQFGFRNQCPKRGIMT